MTLPPLPEPGYWSTRDDDTPLFTSEQMRDYARAALAAVPAQPVSLDQIQAGLVKAFGEPFARDDILLRRIAEGIHAAAPQAAPVPAQPVATSARGLLAAWQASANVLFVSRSSGQYTTDTVSRDDLIQLIEAAFAAAPQAVPVPAGWVLVPVKPTEAMLKAGLDECEPLGSLIDWDDGFGRDEMRDTYAAMLAAAPKEQPHE